MRLGGSELPSSTTYTFHRSFIGYSNVNYALSEVKNPVRTLKIAGPLAIGSVSIVYMLSYGGGLVGGDSVLLDVEVHDQARLVILTQVHHESQLQYPPF